MQRWLNQHLWHRKCVGFCPPFGSLHHSSSFIIHWNKVFQSWGYPNTKQVTQSTKHNTKHNTKQVNHTVRKWFISPSLLWWHQGESLSLGLLFNASITLTNSPFLTNCLGLKFRRRQQHHLIGIQWHFTVLTKCTFAFKMQQMKLVFHLQEYLLSFLLK